MWLLYIHVVRFDLIRVCIQQNNRGAIETVLQLHLKWQLQVSTAMKGGAIDKDGSRIAPTRADRQATCSYEGQKRQNGDVWVSSGLHKLESHMDGLVKTHKFLSMILTAHST